MTKYTIADDNQYPTVMTLSRYKWIVHRIASGELELSLEEREEFARITFALLEDMEIIFTSGTRRE